MNQTYKKYLYASRPMSKRIPMDVKKRAKQFAPFAALRGFEEMIQKQEILYEPRRILSEEQQRELDRRLRMLKEGMEIGVLYFKENSENISEGQYLFIQGNVEFFDESTYLRVDDTTLLIKDLFEISGDAFQILEEPS